MAQVWADGTVPGHWDTGVDDWMCCVVVDHTDTLTKKKKIHTFWAFNLFSSSHWRSFNEHSFRYILVCIYDCPLRCKITEEIILKYEGICPPTVNLFAWKAVAILTHISGV